MPLSGIIVPLDGAEIVVTYQCNDSKPCPISHNLSQLRRETLAAEFPGVSAKAHMKAKLQFIFFFYSLSFDLIGAKYTPFPSSPPPGDSCTAIIM